jgi:DNA topoisomerase-3
VEELSKPELTGEWEYKLAQMEHGKLSREAFMREIAEMTERIVKKAKEYDRDTVPGDYATLQAPCPNCGGVVKENYRRYACTGKSGEGSDACGFSFGKTPAGRTFEPAEVEQFLRDKKIGPLEGFRSKAGWPFTAEMVLVHEEEKNWKLEFDFGDDRKAGRDRRDRGLRRPANRWAPAPSAAARCTSTARTTCATDRCPRRPAHAQLRLQDRQIILQQPVEREQMKKLLATGKTDLLDKFVSMRTRRAFKAFLAWDAEAGKVNFEFEPRPSSRRARRRRQKQRAGQPADGGCGQEGEKTCAAAKGLRAKKAPAKEGPRPRKPSCGEEGGAAQGRPPASSPAPRWLR